MRNISKWVVFGLIFLFGICALVIWYQHQSATQEVKSEQEQANNIETPSLEYGTMPNEMSVVFVHEVSQLQSEEQLWPEVRIMHRTGNNPPEVLATLGKVGEYPSTIRLTPDRRSMFISLESKLVRYDMSTKEIRDFYIPTGSILDFTFSPDGSQVLILDQADANLHVIDIVTANVNKAYIGKASMDSIFIWRSDDMLLGYASKGEGGWSVNFNLKTGREENGTDGTYGALSSDGYLKAVPMNKEKDATVLYCYERGNYSPAFTSVIDSRTSKEIERFGDENHYTAFVAFSPDNREVLYYQENLVSDPNECTSTDRIVDRKYYKMDINGMNQVNQPIMVEDHLSLLTGWGINKLGVGEDYKFNNEPENSSSIVYGDYLIAKSSSFIRLVDAWYSNDGPISNLNSPRKPAVSEWKVFESREWDFYISYPPRSSFRDDGDIVDILPPSGGYVRVDNGCLTTHEMSTQTVRDIEFKGHKAKEYSYRLSKEVDPTQRLYAIEIGWQGSECFLINMSFDNLNQLPELRRIRDSLGFTSLYMGPLKTYTGEGVSVEYPSSWFAQEPLLDSEIGVVSILSPATKQGLDAGTSGGYDFDLNIQYSNDLFKILGNSYTKGGDVSIGGMKGYWVLIQGQDMNEGVVIDRNGYYVFSFPPRMDKVLQNEILKHIKFTN